VHGPNFENNAIALHLRTIEDLDFAVGWKGRPKHLPGFKRFKTVAEI
jgi:hypothetical protein